jgi:HAD superfamily hydrolase (TIGR01490 family)
VTSEASTSRETTAAFFDVDGTLLRSTVVHYYVYFRRCQVSGLVRPFWYAAFVLKCVYFLLLDKIDRGRFNVVFYRSYRGMPAADVKALAKECHRDVIRPRLFEQVKPCIEEHRRAGRKIVLVTGSLDFIVAPLARELDVDAVIAPALVEIGGSFTGELDGPPIGQTEKRRRVLDFARAHAVDVGRSYGYGDAIADLPMLEAVGFPHVVNPDKALADVAKSRSWPVHRWTTAERRGGEMP